VVILAPALAEERLAAFRLGGQVASVALALLAGAVLVRRRSTFDEGRFDV
jgi:hypothetical protein